MGPATPPTLPTQTATGCRDEVDSSTDDPHDQSYDDSADEWSDEEGDFMERTFRQNKEMIREELHREWEEK